MAQRNSLSAPVFLDLRVTAGADDEFGVVEREAIDPQVEVEAVAVAPESADRLPKLLLAVLADGVELVRRAVLVVFSRHGLVLHCEPVPMAASLPVSRPRRKSGAVTSCPKDTAGAELHNAAKL